MSEIDDLRREVKDLRARLAHIPARIPIGGGFSIPVVDVLPAIPTSGSRFVLYNDKLCFAASTYTKWRFLDAFAGADSGEPGT